jgi:hypothetical protein
VLDADELLTSSSGCFTQGKKPGTHGTRGWVGPRAYLDAVMALFTNMQFAVSKEMFSNA